MTDSPRPPRFPNSEALRKLVEFASGHATDLSDEETDALLRRAGIDPAKSIQALRTMASQAKNRARLVDIRNALSRAGETATRLASGAVAKSGTALRAELEALLAAIRSTNPVEAQVFHRRLAETPDGDLQSLLDDLKEITGRPVDEDKGQQ